MRAHTVATPPAPLDADTGRFERRVLDRLSSSRGAVRWPVLAYVPTVVAFAHVRRRVGVPRPVTIPVVAAAPLAVTVALPRRKWRYAAVWATYVWVFKVAWEIPYDRPDKLRRRLRVRENVRLDRVIGGGEPLTLRLQRALRDPHRLTALDIVLTAAYYGLWLGPHAVLMWMLLRRAERFPRAAGRLSAVYHLTTVGYWLRPSAPPWWASEHAGEMDGAVRRVPREVERAVLQHLGRVSARGPGRDGAGDDWRARGNPWASMPSDHFAASCMTAVCLAEVGPKAGAAAWACVLLVGFAVVYLGEHYVADLIAALALAEAVRGAEPAVRPLVRAGAWVLSAFEPAATPRRRPLGGRARLPLGARSEAWS